jgi:hypothetical protein
MNFMASWLQNKTKRKFGFEFRSHETRKQTSWLPGFGIKPKVA